MSDKFLSGILLEIMQDLEKDPEISKFCFKIFKVFLSKNLETNYKKLNLELLIQIMIDSQKKYYSFIEVLISINELAVVLIGNITDNNVKVTLFKIIIKSLDIQDNNPNLVIPALNSILNAISKNSNLLEELAENYASSIVAVLKNLITSFLSCIGACKILTCCSQNPIYCYTLLKFGLMENLSNLLEVIDYTDNPNKELLEKEVLNLLTILSKDSKCSEEISMKLMKYILNYYRRKDLKHLLEQVLKLLIVLTKHKKSIEPFIQQKGISAVKESLQNVTNSNEVADNFKLINNIIKEDDYKKDFIDDGVVIIVKELLEKYSTDKKIEFEGKGKKFQF